MRVLRSRLIIPINVKKFVEKAYLRNADAIVLDLEDSIPKNEKESSRKLIRDALSDVEKSGIPIYIRINSEQEHRYPDIEHSIIKGITGIVVPKVEYAQEIIEIENYVMKLEQKRNLPSGSIAISILIETAKGFLNIEEIVEASDRIESISLGMEDLAYDMGFSINDRNSSALDYLRMKLITVARANDILPLGLLGSIANYTDLDKLSQHAKGAYELGFVGSSCIHPDQVEVFNAAFHHTQEEVKESEKIVDIFNKAIREGRASATYNGQMIDYPHYENAKRVLNRKLIIDKHETRKQAAREKLKGDI